MSHMMIDMADNNELDGSKGKGEPGDSTKKEKVAPKGSLSKHMDPPAGIVNRPLMECYPEIADDEREQLLADVRRHWLGRFFIIFGGTFLAVFMLAFAALLPHFTKALDYNLASSAKAGIALVFVIVAAFIMLGMFISLWVYNQSRMLITDQNVIEVRQMSLFTRKISHLNMLNVEDVTVIKKGILQTFFDYGTMTTETAGEEENFIFVNTPTPDKYRRMVINAHEDAIERIGRMGSAQRVEISKGH